VAQPPPAAIPRRLASAPEGGRATSAYIIYSILNSNLWKNSRRVELLTIQARVRDLFGEPDKNRGTLSPRQLTENAGSESTRRFAISREFLWRQGLPLPKFCSGKACPCLSPIRQFDYLLASALCAAAFLRFEEGIHRSAPAPKKRAKTL
jgi:hypothetical protein